MRGTHMKRIVVLWLALLLVPVVAMAACSTTRTNRKGTNNAAITVSSTAVIVADANTARCSLLIDNVSSANNMRCMSASDGVPTTTAGKLIEAGEALALGDEGKEIWRCIRTGGSDATAEVTEGMP